MNANKLVQVSGHWTDEPQRVFDVLVSLDSWDGDENDHHVFYYTDGEPINVGDIIAEDFVITQIK